MSSATAVAAVPARTKLPIATHAVSPTGADIERGVVSSNGPIWPVSAGGPVRDNSWEQDERTRSRAVARRQIPTTARLLIFHRNAGQGHAGSTPPCGRRSGRPLSPVLAMLAMLGAEEAPARGCAWLRSSLRGG